MKGIGESTLTKVLRRGEILLNNLSPVLYSKINFPKVDVELFFDIEDDPTQEYVYMHGIYERRGKEEQFIHFTAKAISMEEEKGAWGNFWKYISSLPKDGYAVYYYSHHEKTTYLKLQQKYPDVISKEDVETFFNNPNVIDLFKIVNESTDWPVGNIL
ncbi:MAG: ribonuclease H-like domain-containing protein [Chitinophagaceae bacterium]|nr:ribonuclease H-like domain-containing protein [Chitinophagaceae bacterium]